MKALGQAVVLDRQNEHFKMQVERFTFTNLFDLDSYFRD